VVGNYGDVDQWGYINKAGKFVWTSPHKLRNPQAVRGR
jgi:hypothetical protein